MIIKLTDEQVIEMGKLAILASRPMGMGFLHYRSNLNKEDINLEIKFESLSIDYYQGRMVKFNARKMGENSWDFHPEETQFDYQSWKVAYDSYQILADKVLNS